MRRRVNEETEVNLEPEVCQQKLEDHIMTMKTSHHLLRFWQENRSRERSVLDSGRCLADALEFEYRVDLVDLKIPSLL